MEAQAGKESQDRNYGAAFRKGVSRVLDEVGKLEFVTPNLKEKLSLGAAKLCLAEAFAEQKAEEVAKLAKAEWEAKYKEPVKKQVDEAAELLNTVAKQQAEAVRQFFTKKQ